MLALAPDSGSASAGQGLASASKWSSLGKSDRALWGLCQGSGKNPYQVRVDLSEPAFKCSCPSRKFPCKHGIGLMLLLAKNDKAIKLDAEPDWVTDWLAGRSERAEKKAEKAAAIAEKPVDLEAQAARQAKRDARVRDGVAQCRVWLGDLARRGLAAAQTEPGSFWEQTAARMVDNQAPGLALFIRRIRDAISSGEGWDRRSLDWMGRLHMVLAAAERFDALPPELQSDVHTALGRPQSKEEALGQPPLADRWMVLGQVTEEEDRLRTRRTWLLGRSTARRALILDFAAGTQPLDPSLVAGTEFDGELVFYPSARPLRAMVKDRSGATVAMQPLAQENAEPTIEHALAGFATALAKLPWLPRWPMVLQSVVPTAAIAGSRGPAMIDQQGRCLPIAPGFANTWPLIALSGGRPINLLGEWDGEHLLPIAVLPGDADSAFEDVAPRWAA